MTHLIHPWIPDYSNCETTNVNCFKLLRFSVCKTNTVGPKKKKNNNKQVSGKGRHQYLSGKEKVYHSGMWSEGFPEEILKAVDTM